MSKKKMIEKLKMLNKKSIELSKKHTTLLDKYTEKELKMMVEGAIFSIKAAEAMIELLQER